MTLCHTFFVRFLFDRVVVGLAGGDSGASQSACPSSSCRFRMRCSSLCLNLKNMFSFPTRKRISPLPTSILALAALRNGRPRMSSTPRSPSIHYHEVGKDKGISYSHQDVFDYPFGISNHRVCELYSHVCWGKSRVLKFFINYHGHDVHACPISRRHCSKCLS